MPSREKERRACARFVVFGATVTYSGKTGLLARKIVEDERRPVVNMSRGGLLFLSQQNIKPDAGLTITLRDAGDQVVCALKARVIWTSPSFGESYPYKVAVQFAPYGSGADCNPPEDLEKIKELEATHLPATPHREPRS